MRKVPIAARVKASEYENQTPTALNKVTSSILRLDVAADSPDELPAGAVASSHATMASATSVEYCLS